MVEQERLAALRGYAVLDTLPEESFDRLTQLAAELFDVPIALVSLLDTDRQWFKSRFGLDATETPRSWAFCDHAIAAGPHATFVVEDALADPRFVANPLVTGAPNIRFYAGAALTEPGGENLGTLCVIDTKPRTPSAGDLRRLTTLARVVVGELEMRRNAQAAAEKQRLLTLAEAMSGVGHWRLEAFEQRLTWSDEVYRIHDVARDTFSPDLDNAIGFYHPQDQDAVATFINRALSHQEGFEFQLRLGRSDGALRHVACKAECELDEKGQTVAIVGVFQDVTDHVLALDTAERARLEAKEEARRAAVAEEIAGLGRWRVDFPGGVLTWSDQMYAIYGLERSCPVDVDRIMAMTHPDDLEVTQDRLDRDLAGEAAGERPTIRIVRSDGAIRWVIGHTKVEKDEFGRVSAMVGTLMDVSRQTEAARLIAESEARYRLLTENSHDLILKISPDAILQYVSPSITQLLGYQADEMVGRSAEDLVDPCDLDKCRETFAVAASGLDVARADYRLRHKDGSPVWVDARPRALRDEDTGEIVGVTDVIRDVTARKQVEDALASSEARFRLLADNASDIVTETDLEGRFRYVSPAVESITGYRAEEVIGRTAIEFVHPEDRDRVRGEIVQAIRVPEGRQVEHRHIGKDGRVVWVQSRPRLARDPSGRPVAVTDVMRDITERKAAQDAIIESEARYWLLADNATDLILKINKMGRIEYASPAASLLGYRPEEMVGLKRLDLVHPDDRDYAARLMQDLIGGEDISRRPRREYRFRCKDGRYVWLEGNPTVILDALGEFEAVVSAFRDVSVRRSLEDSLAEAKTVAEAATAVKSEFLANMSHEIRTPLTAIIGFTGLLAGRADLPDSARTMINRVKGASAALLSIVNDILDFSKLEAGQMTIDPKPVDAVEVAQDALAMFGPQAEAKSLGLQFDASRDVPDRVWVDPDRLRQVLLNLIGNAVKFTDDGVVRLKLAYDRTGQRLEVRVEDSGAGMDEAQRARLFQRFSQVDASSTRRHGGTGLGLAICKGLTEAMGGSIGVESSPAKGSVFHFNIDAPAATVIQAEPEIVPSAALSGLRVLVTDDNASIRELARALLEPFDVEVTEAADGGEGVALASETPFDVILIDLHMPVLDGVGAVHRIRTEPGPNQNVPILAFTADGAGGFEYGSHGFDGVISKPIVASALVAALVQATQWRSPDLMAQASQGFGETV